MAHATEKPKILPVDLKIGGHWFHAIGVEDLEAKTVVFEVRPKKSETTMPDKIKRQVEYQLEQLMNGYNTRVIYIP